MLFMDKVILNVSVSGINKNYDIEISADINVKKAAEQIFKTISEYEELNAEGKAYILCSKKQKKVLNGELTLKQCDVKDGSELILI